MSNAKVKQLWFGDERGYNATFMEKAMKDIKLWFGDERGYNATRTRVHNHAACCGLVMKEDITQQMKIHHCTELVVVW